MHSHKELPLFAQIQVCDEFTVQVLKILNSFWYCGLKHILKRSIKKKSSYNRLCSWYKREKSCFHPPQIQNPQIHNFMNWKILLLANHFSLGTIFSALKYKIKEVKDNTCFYWIIVRYWNICLEECGFFQSSFLSHVQASQRALNQSYARGFMCFIDEHECLIFQQKNLFIRKFLLNSNKYSNILMFCSLLSELHWSSTTNLITNTIIFTLQ